MAVGASADDSSRPRPRLTLLPPGCSVLAVGEGNFAFSAGLAAARKEGGERRHTLEGGAATGTGDVALVATSLDTEAELVAKYADVGERLDAMRAVGAHVVHGVDATRLGLSEEEGSALRPRGGSKPCPLAGASCFDRIVFNFPLVPADAFGAGLHTYDVHVANRLMLAEFLRRAERLLAPGGLVLIASKECTPYLWWRIECLPEWSGQQFEHLTTLPWEFTEYPQLYDGPCNVNRDASVKPTAAVIYIFARVSGHCDVAGPSARDDVLAFVQEHVRQRLASRVSGRFSCAICGTGDVGSESQLAEHFQGKIHRKRASLEARWQERLAELRGETDVEGTVGCGVGGSDVVATPPAGGAEEHVDVPKAVVSKRARSDEGAQIGTGVE